MMAGNMNEDQIISSWELRESLKDEKPVKFYCGITSVDETFEGFEPGELITLSGPTKHGKTSVFQMLTSGFEKNGVFSLWFAYEVPPKQLIRRFPNLPLFFFPQVIKGRVMSYLDKKIAEAKAKHNIRIVFIDHLHYLLDLSRMSNASIQIGQVIRSLKQLAMKHTVVIFLACHTTKLLPDKEPSADDIRDSSFVSQESDGVLIVWRTKKVDNESRLKLQYHRRIGLIDKIVPLVFMHGELREKAW